MMKPSIPKGTRDFSPVEMARRAYIFDTIRSVFRRFGFGALETPSMENLSTLLGKYGEEGDKLLFRVQNSGEKAALPPEKGLRYDLTVPFARYVVQHQNELAFPFRRYQIQPVWRADRPQRGRYREFTQCDVDVIGTRSLLAEVELLQIVSAVFAELGVRVELRMNNRKVLAGVAERIGMPDALIDLAVALDKIEKAGRESVEQELASKGFSPAAIGELRPILEGNGDLSALERFLEASEVGRAGVAELREVMATLEALAVPLPVVLDFSLARGLNYYTGAIFEVKALDYPMGSICGGGRYDDLTGIFGLPGLSGVGISFGADRIYDVLEGLGAFPPDTAAGTRVLFLNLGAAEVLTALRVAGALRAEGVAVEVYPDAAKMKKQMEYANRVSVPFVAIIGEAELSAGAVTVKNMGTGEQRTIPFDEVATFFR